MLILASASPARRTVLENAGLAFAVEPAEVDEAEVKSAMRAQGAAAADVAAALAERKARAVARAHPDALVIGADQMLTCEGRWYDKPADLAAARRQLARLRGRTHELVSAVVAVSEGERAWRHIDRARLTMRPFSDAFLDDYLARMGDEALSSVGAYRLEGLGAQLFTRIEGDFFSILGLPLLPLLAFLRERGEVAA